MRSQRREEKDRAVEAEDERNVERGPGPGPDIGDTRRTGDVIPVSETTRDGDGGDTTTVAAPGARRRTGTVGEPAARRTVTAAGRAELSGSIPSSRRLCSQLSTR